MKNLHHSNTAPDAPNNTQKGGPLTPSGCGEFTPGGSVWYSEARYTVQMVASPLSYRKQQTLRPDTSRGYLH